MRKVALFLGILWFTTVLAAQSPYQDVQVTGGVVTLYARDPLSHSFCFADAHYGTTLRNGEVLNRCSDLDFGAYRSGALSSGIEGGRLATLLDIGSEVELAQTYTFRNTVGGGQGFASLQLKNRKLYIAGKARGTLQELTGVEGLFAAGTSVASA